MRTICIALALLPLVGMTTAANANMVDVYHRELPDDLLERIDNHFPGNGNLDQMDPAMLTADASLRLTETTSVSLTFLDEKAGFRNEIGYILFDDHGEVLEQQTVFADYSGFNGSSGLLTPGDTIDIGTFDAGTNIGFYLIPNGDSLRSMHTTLDLRNPGLENYTAYYFDEMSGYGVLGFEDLVDKNSWGLGYDDAIMGITTTATVPEPSTTLLLTLGLGVLLHNRSQRRERTCRR